jgi:hypothetical protein
MAKLVLPRVQAMVVCDGMEESIAERSVFLQMSGHAGTTSCHIEISHTDDDVLYQTPSRSITFDGPTATVPIVFWFMNCEFPAPGVYYFQAFCDNKLVHERPLDFVRRSESCREKTPIPSAIARHIFLNLTVNPSESRRAQKAPLASRAARKWSLRLTVFGGSPWRRSHCCSSWAASSSAVSYFPDKIHQKVGAAITAVRHFTSWYVNRRSIFSGGYAWPFTST